MNSWFAKGLIKWYTQYKRDLPWRSETDPYRIWLSEIILQQTQVKQGLSYYYAFIKTFPTVKALAKAPEVKVLKLWQGLGYYSRARNLHHTAKYVTEKYNGKFPKKYEDLLSLKGIGEYTAAAISSFAHNAPHAVVDGNVYRVLSRVFGIDLAVDSTQGKRHFQQLAQALLAKEQAGIYNQAIMEFGSQYCTPKQSKCDACIFSNKCAAYQSDSVNLLPVKSKKTKIRNRYFNYFIVIDKKENIPVFRRSTKDIWEGLHEFILIESNSEVRFDSLLKDDQLRPILSSGFTLLFSSKNYKHILSHQHLFTRFYVLRIAGILPTNITSLQLRSIQKAPFPRLIEKFLQDCDLKELV